MAWPGGKRQLPANSCYLTQPVRKQLGRRQILPPFPLWSLRTQRQRWYSGFRPALCDNRNHLTSRKRARNTHRNRAPWHLQRLTHSPESAGTSHGTTPFVARAVIAGKLLLITLQRRAHRPPVPVPCAAAPDSRRMLRPTGAHGLARAGRGRQRVNDRSFVGAGQPRLLQKRSVPPTRPSPRPGPSSKAGQAGTGTPFPPPQPGQCLLRDACALPGRPVRSPRTIAPTEPLSKAGGRQPGLPSPATTLRMSWARGGMGIVYKAAADPPQSASSP